MNRSPLTDIAPGIFRKRLLIEGICTRQVTYDVLYTCAPFDEHRATELVREFFDLAEHQAAIF